MRAERHHYGVFRDASIELLRAVENGAVGVNSVDMAAFAGQGAQTIVGMMVTRPVEMVDVPRLVSSVASDREVVQALRGQSVESALMSEDYSFARAISHGISDANAGYSGLVAPTARAVITAPASNLVFFGDPENTVATVPLQPMLIYNVNGLTSGGRLRVNVRNAEASPSSSTSSSETSSGTQSS